MTRVRFTRAERDTLAELRKRHTAEAIYREAQRARSVKAPGAPKHCDGDSIAVWVCVEVKRAVHRGKRPSVREACRLLAGDLRGEDRDGRIVGERLGASRLRAMHREVEIRAASDPDFAESISKHLAAQVARVAGLGGDTIVLPARLKYEAFEDAHMLVVLAKSDRK
jgi:hypothetical protein